MSNRFLLPALLLLSNYGLAQTVSGTYGPSYIIQGFYNFQGDEMTNVLNTDWDIAFSTAGSQDAGIHVNEAVESMGNELELYQAPTNDFNDVISPGNLDTRLYNDEVSWNFGAFNGWVDPTDPDDYGWGFYSQSEDAIIGDKVFVLKFRNGTYKKIQILSLSQGVYTFKYANLDGSNEVTHTINKADQGDITFFSFSGTGGVVDFIPEQWDLWFTRYSSPLDDGSPNPVNYEVTGVLSGYGVEVAEAKGIDPQTVTFEAYEDSLHSELGEIGYGWKEININTFQWTIFSDLAYFVKTASGDVWKVIFTSFSGSSSGDFAFTREFVGNFSAIEEQSVFTGMEAYPNPITDEATIAFSLKQAGIVRLVLYNTMGQVTWSRQVEANAGFNVQILPDLNIPSGTYALSLQFQNGDTISRMVAIH